MSQRQAFVATVSRLLAEDEAVILLLGDISVHAFRDAAAAHPGRVLNLGTCEQAMVSFAAGLALDGRYPVISTIDPFIVRRAYEQVHLDFGRQDLKGMFVTVGAGRAYSSMGPSHWDDGCALLMATVPGMICGEPSDDAETAMHIEVGIAKRLLAYVRLRA